MLAGGRGSLQGAAVMHELELVHYFGPVEEQMLFGAVHLVGRKDSYGRYSRRRSKACAKEKGKASQRGKKREVSGQVQDSRR
jgi:hypothetical protein